MIGILLPTVKETKVKINKINGSRIKITLRLRTGSVIDYQYHHQILGLIYNFLKSSDPSYADWMHLEGYRISAGATSQSHKNFKFFCVSGIKFHGRIKAIATGVTAKNSRESLLFSFQIASPLKSFVQHLIVGLFELENSIHLGQSVAFIETVETLPKINIQRISKIFNMPSAPLFPEKTTAPHKNCHSRPDRESSHISLPKLNTMGFLKLKPLASPIFVKKPMPYGENDKYLFPGDSEFTHYLNVNLKDKYRALFGELCPYEDLIFEFYESLTPPTPSFLIKTEGATIDCHSRPDRESSSPTVASSAPPLLKGDTRRFHKKQPTEKVIEIPTKTGRPIKIKGTLKPFKVSGHPELIRLGLYAGFGSNNAMGCGYVEVREDA